MSPYLTYRDGGAETVWVMSSHLPRKAFRKTGTDSEGGKHLGKSLATTVKLHEMGGGTEKGGLSLLRILSGISRVPGSPKVCVALT